METKVALRRIFSQPSSVFAELRGKRKWVPAMVFMAVLLALHGLVTAVGTYSENAVGDLIETQSPIEFTTHDSSHRTSEVDEASEPSEDKTNDQNIESDAFSSQVGKIALILTLTVLMVPVAYALLCFLCFIDAIYLRIVGAIMHLEFKFGDWFALSVWSRVPGIALSVLAIVVGIIALGKQPHPDDLDILRLTRWVDLPEVHHEGENWSVGASFDHYDAYLIWVILLQTIGFKEWSGKSALFSFGIVIAPTIIVIALASIVIAVA